MPESRSTALKAGQTLRPYTPTPLSVNDIANGDDFGSFGSTDSKQETPNSTIDSSTRFRNFAVGSLSIVGAIVAVIVGGGLALYFIQKSNEFEQRVSKVEANLQALQSEISEIKDSQNDLQKSKVDEKRLQDINNRLDRFESKIFR